MDDKTLVFWMILSVVGVVAAVAITIVFLRRFQGVKSEKKSISELPNDEHKGRDAILRQLRRFAAVNEFKVLEPVALTGVHGTTDLDAILVGWFGVLGVKCLGYGGTVYGNAEEEDWVQEMNGRRRTFKNPMTRSQQSNRVIRDVLFSTGLKSIPVETVVVFTGKSTELALPRSTGHYTEKTFGAYLKSTHFEEDKKVEIEPIVKLLTEKNAQ